MVLDCGLLNGQGYIFVIVTLLVPSVVLNGWVRVVKLVTWKIDHLITVRISHSHLVSQG